MFYKNRCDIIIVSNDEYNIGGTSSRHFHGIFLIQDKYVIIQGETVQVLEN